MTKSRQPPYRGPPSSNVARYGRIFAARGALLVWHSAKNMAASARMDRPLPLSPRRVPGARLGPLDERDHYTEKLAVIRSIAGFLAFPLGMATVATYLWSFKRSERYCDVPAA